MYVNREELKSIIDHIPDQAAVEVLDFIEQLTTNGWDKNNKNHPWQGLERQDDIPNSKDDGQLYHQSKVLEYQRGEIL